MTQPVRMRLSRAAGFKLQTASRALNGLDAVHVGRPGKLGNPFVVSEHGTRQECVEWQALLLAGFFSLAGPPIAAQRAHRDAVLKALPGLKGKNIACWCRLDGGPCHGDTLLRLANAKRRPVPVERLVPSLKDALRPVCATVDGRRAAPSSPAKRRSR